MTDLVERLREAFQRKRYGAGGDYDPDFDLFDVAADELERLTKQCDAAHDYRVAMEHLDAQTIVGLRAEIERLRTLGPDDDWEERGAAGELQTEIERLRRALQQIADYPHNGPTETMLLRGHARMALEPKL
jgi:hypothetical protein